MCTGQSWRRNNTYKTLGSVSAHSKHSRCVFWLLFFMLIIISILPLLQGKWKWSRSVMSDSLWPHGHQAPPSMGFSRQEYWSGLPFPSPGNYPSQGSNPGLPHCGQTLYHLSHQGSLVSFRETGSKRLSSISPVPHNVVSVQWLRWMWPHSASQNKALCPSTLTFPLFTLVDLLLQLPSLVYKGISSSPFCMFLWVPAHTGLAGCMAWPFPTAQERWLCQGGNPCLPLKREKALAGRGELQVTTWWTSGSQGPAGERGSEKAVGQGLDWQSNHYNHHTAGVPTDHSGQDTGEHRWCRATIREKSHHITSVSAQTKNKFQSDRPNLEKGSLEHVRWGGRQAGQRHATGLVDDVNAENTPIAVAGATSSALLLSNFNPEATPPRLNS